MITLTAMEKPEGRNKTGVRTTISLTKLVAQWADEMMEKRGYDNFSAYVAELIRKDKDDDDSKTLMLIQARSGGAINLEKVQAARKEFLKEGLKAASSHQPRPSKRGHQPSKDEPNTGAREN